MKADVLQALNLADCDTAHRLSDLLRRTGVSMDGVLAAVWCVRQDAKASPSHFAESTRSDVEDEIKYAGYIAREAREIARLSDLEFIPIPADLPYAGSSGLSAELQEKLAAIKPTTLGQASRIPGMTPAALRLLRVHLHRKAA